MAWIKLTTKNAYLMKGGTNQFLEEVELVNGGKNFKLPKKWFASKVPMNVIIDIGSAETPSKATNHFDGDSLLKTEVLNRKEWNANPPRSKFEIIERPRAIFIHHTAGPASTNIDNAKVTVKSIQDFHMGASRGWSDIGYNFLVSTQGALFEGRQGSLEAAISGRAVRGAHAGTNDGNRSPAVSSIGDFSNTPMNEDQWNGLVKICAALCEECDIDPANIKGHRDFVPNSCPGDWLYNRLGELRDQVASLILS